MKIALVHLDDGGARLRAELVRVLHARGDDVTRVCGGDAEPPQVGSGLVKLKPFALGAAARLKAFANAADEHVRSAGYDLVLGSGESTVHDVVRLSAGCAQTRIDLAQGGRATSEDAARLAVESRALAKGAFRRVVAPSSLVKKDVERRHGAAPDSVRVVNEGVDLARFHPARRGTDGPRLRTESKLAPEDFVVLLRGAELDKLELGRLLRVVPELASERPSLRIVVTEAANDPRALEKLAAPLGERVRFVHETPTSELLPIADLLFMHTRSTPFANETLEALACGVPVITSAFDGACELVEEDVTGSILIGFGDSQSVYRVLARWTKLERAREAGARARKAAEAHAVGAKAAEMLAILDEVAIAKSRA
jgi:UDP-glucose:(heptosyl)LPS alpha-1,3-glucosyltransferase